MSDDILGFLKADPVEMAEKVIANLRAELLKLKTERDKEQLPWFERRAHARDEDEARALSQRIHEIGRNYEGSIAMLEREIVRIWSLLPPKPFFIAANKTEGLDAAEEQVRAQRATTTPPPIEGDGK